MSKKRKHKNIKNLWILKAAIITFILSAIFSFTSETLMSKANVIIAVIIIMLIIATGVVFDIIGVALTSVDKAPFYAMASKKVYASKQCSYLVGNAEVLSNICNDIIGDICGIISGACGTAVALRLAMLGGSDLMLSVIISAIIASATVGGKAYGKSIAIKNNKKIILMVGNIIAFFDKGKK